MAKARTKEADTQRLRLQSVEAVRLDPLGFVRWAFPWGDGPLAGHDGPEAWQADVLREIGRQLRANAQGERSGPVRIAVASGHGVGKSALVAWLLLWASATVPSTRGVVTANTETQLKTKTWVELGKWHGLVTTGDFNELGATSLASVLPVPEGAGRIDLVPWAAHNAEAFAGLHNKGSRILVVFDEASAIADAIWETAEGAMTDADTEIIWIAFGNPTRTSGRFFECFNRFRENWHTRQVDSREVSLTDKQQLARWVADYGEDSDFVRVRVRGQFPRAGTMQFIDGERVQQAMTRILDPATDTSLPLVMGVDVARFGDDRSVIVLRRGRDARSFAIEKHRGMDLMTLAGRVAEIAFAHGPAAIFVDETGLGAGVVDRLRQLGVQHVQGVNFGASAARWDGDGAKSLYANKRAEMWGNLKDWLKAGGALPDDPELRADLTGVEYGYTGTGEIQLEKKEDMKKRGLASPDIGDALALTFAHPVPANWGWDAPMKVRILDEDHEYDFFHDL
ncbi:MAG: terminase [Reyranella sp.]|nr:terminase [Reyranella sp.]